MRLWIVLAILGFGLVVLLLNGESGRSFGMDNDDFGRLVALLPFAAMLSAGILLGRRNLGESLRQMTWWVLIALVLVTGYLYRGELEGVGNRLMAGLVPGRAVTISSTDGSGVILHKAAGGHFVATVAVNGEPLEMLVDTGASSIALSYEDARSVGINTERLRFSQPIMTANGRTMGAPVRLDNVSLGPITRNNVAAIVGQPGTLDGSLLGMTFLSTLSSLEIRTDELRLMD